MRSIRSWMIERLLKRFSNKRRFTDEKLYTAFLKDKQKKNEQPYVLPKYFQWKYDVKKRCFNEMEYYIFNQGKAKSKNTILYLHGGGYIKQPSIFHWRFIGKIAEETNRQIIVPIYPKAPNCSYEQAFEKVLPLYKWLEELTDQSTITLMGDSAGGGFALALAQWLLKKELPQPQDIILLSPWLDITMENPEAARLEERDPMLGIYGLVQMGKSYAGNANPNYYLLSPLNGELNGLGKITLFVGTHEVLLPDARKFRDIALSKGVSIKYYEYPKMNHIFVLFPIPEAKKARKKIVHIIKGG